MGYKKTIRSISAAANRASKERDKQSRQAVRANAKVQNKISEAYEKLEKIFNSLEDIYAKGSIDNQQYKELKNREEDITIDLVVFGKAAGVSLAKRYVTGKIDKEEFEQIKCDILPEELLIEKQRIQEGIGEIENNIKDFQEICNCLDEKKCACCEREKSLLNPLKIEDGLRLCRKCKNKFLSIQNYKGYKGKYLSIDPCCIKISNKEWIPQVHLNPDFL